MDVLALLGKKSTGGTGAGSASVLPSGRARAAIERLASLGTIEALDATQPNLKVICKDLFDWHSTTGQSSVNGNVVKAFGRALTARDANGASLYSQAVEMAGFASAAAPLLQPDRLARIIDLAPTVTTAFAPERYTMQLTGALRTLLSRYQEARREQLLASLWAAGHDGRWWDMTSGVVTVKVGPPRRRGQVAPDPDVDDDAPDLDAQIRNILAGEGAGTPAGHATIAEALLEGKLTYNPATAGLVRALPQSDQLAEGLAKVAESMRSGEFIDPDVALLASHLPWLVPSQRPESPMTWLAKTLVRAITPDPTTGEVKVDVMPDKPKEWKDLYPLAEIVGFPYGPTIRALEHSIVPGTAAVIELIKNPAELAANRQYMGNCTYTYKERIERGQNVLLKVWEGNDCYNVALWRGARYGRVDNLHAATRWELGEVNSRFNAGRVPAHITAGINRLVNDLPAPDPLPEFLNAKRNQIRYAV